MSINSVNISGNLGRDPKLRATKTGMQVLSFSVCVNARVKRNGEWTDKANWVDVTLYGNRAESLSRYLAKGTHVTVSGRLDQRTWEAKDGTKRSKLEVICDEIDFTGGKREQGQEPAEDAGLYDEDIPF